MALDRVRRVLIVDDVPFCQAALKKCLLTAGYDVACCVSGTEALRLLMREPGITAVLCDLMMPQMDGVDLLRRAMILRWAQGLEPLPFILLTASCDTHRLRQAEKAGFLSVIHKPASRERLLQALNDSVKQSA